MIKEVNVVLENGFDTIEVTNTRKYYTLAEKECYDILVNGEEVAELVEPSVVADVIHLLQNPTERYTTPNVIRNIEDYKQAILTPAKRELQAKNECINMSLQNVKDKSTREYLQYITSLPKRDFYAELKDLKEYRERHPHADNIDEVNNLIFLLVQCEDLYV